MGKRYEYDDLELKRPDIGNLQVGTDMAVGFNPLEDEVQEIPERVKVYARGDGKLIDGPNVKSEDLLHRITGDGYTEKLREYISKYQEAPAQYDGSKDRRNLGYLHSAKDAADLISGRKGGRKQLELAGSEIDNRERSSQAAASAHANRGHDRMKMGLELAKLDGATDEHRENLMFKLIELENRSQDRALTLDQQKMIAEQANIIREQIAATRGSGRRGSSDWIDSIEKGRHAEAKKWIVNKLPKDFSYRYKTVASVMERAPELKRMIGFGANAMPNFLLTKQGKEIRQDAQDLYNREHKEFAGTAVTAHEQVRLERAYGMINKPSVTYDEFMHGMSILKDVLDERLKTTYMTFPEAAKELVATGAFPDPFGWRKGDSGPVPNDSGAGINGAKPLPTTDSVKEPSGLEAPVTPQAKPAEKMVEIRRLKDGVKKKVPESRAKFYLDQTENGKPRFEVAQ